MKRSSFTEEQIAHVLRQAEAGVPVQELVRKTGITEQTFYRWKRRFGGMGWSSFAAFANSKTRTSKTRTSKTRTESSNNWWPTWVLIRPCSRRCEPSGGDLKKL
jgi:transposase-like protein